MHYFGSPTAVAIPLLFSFAVAVPTGSLPASTDTSVPSVPLTTGSAILGQDAPWEMIDTPYDTPSASTAALNETGALGRNGTEYLAEIQDAMNTEFIQEIAQVLDELSLLAPNGTNATNFTLDAEPDWTELEKRDILDNIEQGKANLTNTTDGSDPYGIDYGTPDLNQTDGTPLNQSTPFTLLPPLPDRPPQPKKSQLMKITAELLGIVEGFNMANPTAANDTDSPNTDAATPLDNMQTTLERILRQLSEPGDGSYGSGSRLLNEGWGLEQPPSNGTHLIPDELPSRGGDDGPSTLASTATSSAPLPPATGEAPVPPPTGQPPAPPTDETR